MRHPAAEVRSEVLRAKRGQRRLVAWGVVMLVLLLYPAERRDTSSMANAAGQDAIIIAHRGASGCAPENTLAAFDLATEMNADYIELDLRLTRDGHLVVIHDEGVYRTTDGFGRVSGLTLAEIRAFDAGSWFGNRFAGQRVPIFEEVLDRYAGRVGLLVEIKDPARHPGIAERIEHVLRSRGLDRAGRRVILQSFDQGFIEALSARLPEIALGVLLYTAIDEAELDRVARYAAFANVDVRVIDSRFVEAAHRYGMEVWAWTIRDAEGLQRALHAGADGIITDYPDLSFRCQ